MVSANYMYLIAKQKPHEVQHWCRSPLPREPVKYIDPTQWELDSEITDAY